MPVIKKRGIINTVISRFNTVKTVQNDGERKNHEANGQDSAEMGQAEEQSS